MKAAKHANKGLLVARLTARTIFSKSDFFYVQITNTGLRSSDIYTGIIRCLTRCPGFQVCKYTRTLYVCCMLGNQGIGYFISCPLHVGPSWMVGI